MYYILHIICHIPYAAYMWPEICAYWNYKSFYINLYPMVLDLPETIPIRNRYSGDYEEAICRTQPIWRTRNHGLTSLEFEQAMKSPYKSSSYAPSWVNLFIISSYWVQWLHGVIRGIYWDMVLKASSVAHMVCVLLISLDASLFTNHTNTIFFLEICMQAGRSYMEFHT